MEKLTNLTQVTEHALMRRLAVLDLDRDHFVIFGSAPLLLYGIRSKISDLDIVARGPAWERAQMLGESVVGPLNGAPMIHFWGGLIEVSHGWVPGEWDINELIDSADIVEGFRFAKLADVLLYKQSLMREKDALDIVAIEANINSSLQQISSSKSSPIYSPRRIPVSG